MKRVIPQILLAGVLLLQACGSPASATQEPAAEIPSPASSEQVTATVESAPPTGAPAPTNQPQPTSTIEHTTVPTEGITDRATAHDNEESLSYQTKKIKTGDFLRKNVFERPFTSIEMEYLPDVDIADFSITSDDNFFYIKISLIGLNPKSQALTGSYGVEIDRNADGRAELLLVTRPPYSTEFSTDGTSAYLDINGDVGGQSINRPDDYDSNGFEAVVFDLAQGIHPEDDPDFLWARTSTYGNLPAIELAFKKWIFDSGKEAFMWSVVSSAEELNPSEFYFHDHYSVEEAGTANTDTPYYPLKDLAGMDNTCRIPIGFQVTGNEPMGCYVKDGEVEEIAEPDANGVNSTCGQFSELCKRTENTRLLIETK